LKPAGQRLPQAPQLSSSVIVSTQVEPQQSGVAPSQLGWQSVPPPPRQFPALHVWPVTQWPQLPPHPSGPQFLKEQFGVQTPGNRQG
jgi:hypothetical protein